MLVGFFLDDSPPFYVVKSYLKKFWRLKGKITMRYDNSLFYFDFACPKDRLQILEAGLVIIMGMPFIATRWPPSVGVAREQYASMNLLLEETDWIMQEL